MDPGITMEMEMGMGIRLGGFGLGSKYVLIYGGLSLLFHWHVYLHSTL
jgi:hypothetical protein